MAGRFVRAETLAGLLFMAFGAAALWLSADYSVGTSTRMGPGWVPIALGWSLTALGGGIAVAGFAGAAGDGVPQSDARPLLFLLLGVASFALLLEHLGLLAAISACVGVARLAERPYRIVETALLAAGLAALGAALFVGALGLPIPLVPR